MTTAADALRRHRLDEELRPSLEDDNPKGSRDPKAVLGLSQSLFITADGQNPSRRKYRLFIDAFQSDGDSVTHQIHNCLLDAQTTDTLEIRLNNNGGSVSEGMRLLHVMSNQFNGRSTVVLECNALSMAAMIFCNGAQRVIHPLSRLMFHNYSSLAVGKGGELEDSIVQENSTRDKLYQEVLANGWLTQDEYTRMLDGKDIWLEFDELISRGIATHVMDEGDRVPVDQY
jgi:ATP-dependent protease ClpP protease subunit